MANKSVDTVRLITLSVGKDLRAMRRRAGLTQAQAARKAKIFPETLSRLENGLGNPGVKLINRVVRAIDPIAYKTRPVNRRRKIVRVEIRNTDLDALEDLLYCKLTDSQRLEAETKAKRLWRTLVSVFDDEGAGHSRGIMKGMA